MADEHLKDELDILESFEEDLSGSKPSAEKRDELSQLLAGLDNGDRAELQGLKAQDESVEKDPAKVEDASQNDDDVERASLSREALSSLDLFDKQNQGPVEEEIKFDVDAFAKVLAEDPVAAMGMISEARFGVREPEKRVRAALDRIDQMENDYMELVATDFVDSNEDYPADDPKVNQFMVQTLAANKLRYNKRNLQSVWNKAKTEGWVTVPKAKAGSVKETAAKVKPENLPPPVKGRSTNQDRSSTGAINPNDDALMKIAEQIAGSDKDWEELEPMLQRAGLMEPGSLSRFNRAD